MRKFACDFETSTPSWLEKDNEARVWAYSICEIGNPTNFIYGNNIDDFMEWCSYSRENYTCYFHNIKFDGEYIISWLLNNGFEFIKNKNEQRDKTFTTLISDLGQFYSIEVYFKVYNKKVNKVTFYDSLKLLNFGVEKIAKDFKLPISKLELDYDTYREKGHVLTEHEIDYIRNDVEIMARALEIMFNNGLSKMTIGSCALNNYKDINTNFSVYFPILKFETDKEIRASYKGGFTYLNEVYNACETGEGIVLDVNSLYPSVMAYEKMPFGNPIYFKGKYENDSLHPLYVQKLSCSFEIKEGMIPTIQIKNSLAFKENEYLKSSNGDVVTLTLTNIDLDLFLKHYEVHDLDYIGGYKFKAISGLFTNYIDHWSQEKINAKKEGNGALYLISKLMLNSLYGKFGLNPSVRSKYPYLNEDGVVSYMLSEREERDSIYIPVATFITSYARRKTITTSQKIKDYTKETYSKDYYIYSDTDSIHMLALPEEELKKFVDIDDYKLGAWKLESKFKRGKFIRQKCYIEEDYDGEVHATIAGLPKKLGKIITFDNFELGFSTEQIIDLMPNERKLTFKHVKGGVVLTPTEFTIK